MANRDTILPSQWLRWVWDQEQGEQPPSVGIKRFIASKMGALSRSSRTPNDSDGTFRLSTLFRGPSMCLDIFNGGPKNNQPHFANCANLSGQLWNILVTQDGDMVRLTTKFRGPGMCLDIFNGGPNNNQPHLANCANLSGQLWTLTKPDKRVESATKTN